VNGAAGLNQRVNVPPIHARKMHGALARHGSRRAQRILQEFDKFIRPELARRHGKFGMFDTAATNDVLYFDIVWRIEKRHCGAGLAQNFPQGLSIPSISAPKPMRPKVPQIPGLALGWAGRVGIEFIKRIGRVFLKINEYLINLNWREASDLNIEILSNQKLT